MTDQPNTPTQAIHPRLPGELHARLKAHAADSRRSMNADVILAIEQYLERAASND